MSPLIECNVFTNARVEAPSTSVLEATLASLDETFGLAPTRIYYDPHPFVEHAAEYQRNLERVWGEDKIIKTTGFAHGYMRSIVESEADFLFQLEDDWSFQNIEHELVDIVRMMRDEGIPHFRFTRDDTREENYPNKWTTYAIEKESNGIKYLETDNVSNNPHIINRKHYIENRLQYIDPTETASFGVEENLTRKGLVSCQYGGFGYPPTLTHLTKLTKKDRRK